MRKMFCTLLLIGAALGVGTAQAQQTWFPNYDSNSVVQVAPQMEGQPGVNFSSDFADKVRERAAANNLEVHFIVTQQGNDLRSSQRTQWSAGILHTVLWDQWVSQGMNESHALVCLYIRSNDSPSGSIACRSGSYLHSLGVGAPQFGAANGPVNSVGSAGTFRTDVQGAFLTVLDNINNLTGGVSYSSPNTSSNSGSPTNSQSSSNFWFWFWVVVVIVVVVLVIIALASRGGSGGSGGGFFFFGGGGGGCSSGGSCSSGSSGSSCGGGGGGCSSCGGGGGA